MVRNKKYRINDKKKFISLPFLLFYSWYAKEIKGLGSPGTFKKSPGTFGLL
jgi:hypothetical protein